MLFSLMGSWVRLTTAVKLGEREPAAGSLVSCLCGDDSLVSIESLVSDYFCFYGEADSGWFFVLRSENYFSFTSGEIALVLR